MQYIRSVIFFAIMVISAILYSIPSILTFPFPFKMRYAFIRQWARFNIWTLGILCNLRYEVIGKENIPQTPAVILCKHQSTWETYALQMIFPPQVWVLKKQLLRVPFFGWGLSMLDPIAIDRSAKKQAMSQIIDQGKQRLESGRFVVIFPEGTRIAPGKRGTYKLGGARLASAAGFPIVPVAHNAGEYWRRHGLLKKPGVITLCVGPVIDPTDKSPQEINKLAEDWIENKMSEITTLK